MVKLRHLPIRGDRSNGCDFSIFQDGVRRHRGFLKFHILTVWLAALSQTFYPSFKVRSREKEDVESGRLG